MALGSMTPDALMIVPPNHREACEAVARWMFKRAWCDLAVCEIGGRGTGTPPIRPVWGVVPAGDPRWEEWRHADKAFDESPASGGGVLDVLALTTPAKDRAHALDLRIWEKQRERADERGYAFQRKCPRLRPQIAIAEIKVQRSDLRQDLRRRKLLRYEPQASRVYLAATPEALGGDSKSVLPDLEARGLPPHWGVLCIPWRRDPNGHLRMFPESLRTARAYGAACDPTHTLRERLTNAAAISLAHRAVRWS